MVWMAVMYLYCQSDRLTKRVKPRPASSPIESKIGFFTPQILWEQWRTPRLALKS